MPKPLLIFIKKIILSSRGSRAIETATKFDQNLCFCSGDILLIHSRFNISYIWGGLQSLNTLVWYRPTKASPVWFAKYLENYKVADVIENSMKFL